MRLVRILLLLAAFGLLLWPLALTTGCKATGRPADVKQPAAPTGTSKGTESVVSEVGTSATALQASAKAIDKQVVAIDDKVAELRVLSPTSTPELSAITTSTVAIAGESAKVTAVSMALNEQRERLSAAVASIRQLEDGVSGRDKQIATLQSSLEKAHGEIKAAEDKANSALRRMLMFAVIAGLVAVGVSAMLVVNGNGKAIGIGVGGAVLSMAAIGFSVFLANIAWIACIAAVIVLAIVAWKIWEKRQDEKTEFELVKTTEKLKRFIPPEAKERLFGDLVGDGEVGQLQSEATKSKVRKLREKLNTAVRPIVIGNSEPRT